LLIDVVLRRPVLIVGEGEEMVSKVKKFLDRGASVIAIAGSAEEGLHELLATYGDRLSVKAMDLGSLDPSSVPVADIGVVAVKERSLAVKLKGVLSPKVRFLNFADMPDLCDFYLPASFKKGPIEVGVSTGGMSPYMASSLRRRLEAQVSELDALKVELLGALRPVLLSRFREPSVRSSVAEAVIHDQCVVERLYSRDLEGAMRISMRIIEAFGDGSR